MFADAVMSAVSARHRVVAPEQPQDLPGRTGVLIQLGIDGEVGAAKRAVVAAALVLHRNVWLDRLVGQPAEEPARWSETSSNSLRSERMP